MLSVMRNFRDWMGQAAAASIRCDGGKPASSRLGQSNTPGVEGACVFSACRVQLPLYRSVQSWPITSCTSRLLTETVTHTPSPSRIGRRPVDAILRRLADRPMAVSATMIRNSAAV
jgi:hypothetical protein